MIPFGSTWWQIILFARHVQMLIPIPGAGYSFALFHFIHRESFPRRFRVVNSKKCQVQALSLNVEELEPRWLLFFQLELIIRNFLPFIRIVCLCVAMTIDTFCCPMWDIIIMCFLVKDSVSFYSSFVFFRDFYSPLSQLFHSACVRFNCVRPVLANCVLLLYECDFISLAVWNQQKDS